MQSRASRGLARGRVRSSYPAQRVAKCSEGRRIFDSEQALGAPHGSAARARSARFTPPARHPCPLATRRTRTCDDKSDSATIRYHGRAGTAERGRNGAQAPPLRGRGARGRRQARPRPRAEPARPAVAEPGQAGLGPAKESAAEPRAAAPVAVAEPRAARPHARAELPAAAARRPRRGPLGRRRWRPLRRRGRPGELRRRRLRRPAAAEEAAAVQRRLPRLHERQVPPGRQLPLLARGHRPVVRPH